jgi:SWI/SNF-related matrix-associated actin-dependent regulator 1 of chromatin subfamily A
LTPDLNALMGTLYPFQRRGVEFHLSHHYSINGCKMGLGKTIQAIATIAHTKGSVCIVCPAYLKRNWHTEIDKFMPQSFNSPLHILSYEGFLKYAPKECSVLVFDEAHYLKNMDSKRTKFAHKYVKENKPNHLLLLSGTPIKNRVTEFYSLMKLCSYNPQGTSGLPLTKGFHTFAKALCDSFEMPTPYGSVTRYTGLKNKPLLVKYLIGKYFSAKNDKPLPQMYRQYIEVSAKMSVSLQEEIEKDFASNHISSSKRNLALLKAGFTASYIVDCAQNEELPILVFSDHIDSCHAIDEQLKLKRALRTRVITGATPSDDRSRFVDQFQNGLIDVLIATIGSMSTGFTLTATNRVVFNDLSWCPADNEQAEKRIHRIGQKRDCFVVHILAEGIDRKIRQVLEEKQATLDKLYSS